MEQQRSLSPAGVLNASRPWRMTIGLIGLVAGLGLVVIALATPPGGSVFLKWNAVMVGLAFSGCSIIGLIGGDRAGIDTLTATGSAAVLAGAWAVIGPFLLGAPHEQALFAITVVSGLVAVPMAAEATLNRVADEKLANRLNLWDSPTQREQAIRRWKIGTGLVGVVLGGLLVGAALLFPVGQVHTLPHTLWSGMLIAGASAISAWCYTRRFMQAGQVAGALAALGGLWAVAGAFAIGMPHGSVLFFVTLAAGEFSALLAGYGLVGYGSQ